MNPQTLGMHRRTYDALFEGPAPWDLRWRDVHAMLAALADEERIGEGRLRFTRNGQSLDIRPPIGRDFADAGVAASVRGFLDRSGAGTIDGVAEGMHLLVVVDERAACVYRTELHGAVPERVRPYAPDGAAGRYLHGVAPTGVSPLQPESIAPLRRVAEALFGAEQVLVFGCGTGSSRAMQQLVRELQHGYGAPTRCVVGAVVIDAACLTEEQMLARVRAFYVSGIRHV